MTPYEGLCALAASQHSYIRRRDARDRGYSAKVVRRWIADHEWCAEGSRLLRRAGAPPGKGPDLMRAALDAGTGAVISGPTVAAWWGLPGFDLLQPHVTRPRGITSAVPEFAAHLHEVTDLTTDQVTVLDGVPVVRPERMAFELLALVPRARAERAIETAWAKGLLSGSSLRATLDQLAERGRTGIVAMREFLEAHPVDWVPPASNLEARFAALVAAAGLGAWRRQVDLGATSWAGRVDFLHESLPVVVEVQSERYHTALLDRAADAVRKAKLEDAGFVVVEVWDTWVWHDRRRVLAAVRAGLSAARGELAA
jgi:very-short-patch-repair endonuclease